MKAANNNKQPPKKWNPNAKQQNAPVSKAQKNSPPPHQLSRITEIQSDDGGSQSSSELDSMDSGEEDNRSNVSASSSSSSSSSKEEDKHFLEEMKRLKAMQLQPPKKQQQQQQKKPNQMTAIMMMNHNANLLPKPKGGDTIHPSTQNKAAEDANDIVYKALMDHKRAEMQRMTTLASDARTITEAMLRKQVSLFCCHV